MPDADVLMHETYDSLRPGPIREVVDGPFREMHAQPASPEDNLGGWARRFGYWSLRGEAWRLVETPDGRFVESCVTATVYDNVWLAKGDPAWRDVAVRASVSLLRLGEGWGGPAGLVFRFLDGRRHYAACVDEDGMAKILKRDGNHWDVLAAAPASIEAGTPFEIRIEARGEGLRAEVGPVLLEAVDAAFATGRVGFVGARPARFGPLTVTGLPGERERLETERRVLTRSIEARRARYGRPVAWRELDTRGFGSGRRVRLGDLTGDGRLDFLLLQLDTERAPALACMTAVSAGGDVMWQLGTPRPAPATELSADGPAQVHDVDGDGRCEVVCAWEGEIVVLDGATGERKQSAPLPPMGPLPELFKRNMLHWGAGFNDGGPCLVASAVCFADLAGRGRPADILLADPYHTLVALGPDLRELWRTTCSHGHFPQAFDFDGDGRDDVLAGYQRLSPDGEVVARVCLQDHQDAIYVGPLDAEGAGPVKILMAGGEDGLLTLTPEYDLRQRVMGHVQRLSVGRFREDVPGLSVATCLYHGSPGIVSLFDSTLKRLWTRDFPVVGTTLQPVNWDGSGTELMLLSGIRPSQGYPGGLIDGEGDLVVPLPDDGGPGLCAFAHDFDGDGLDELMLWDHDRIWIYHCDREPPRGQRYGPRRSVSAVVPTAPRRPPLWNASNFQAYWSRPAWE